MNQILCFHPGGPTVEMSKLSNHSDSFIPGTQLPEDAWSTTCKDPFLPLIHKERERVWFEDVGRPYKHMHKEPPGQQSIVPIKVNSCTLSQVPHWRITSRLIWLKKLLWIGVVPSWHRLTLWSPIWLARLMCSWWPTMSMWFTTMSFRYGHSCQTNESKFY